MPAPKSWAQKRLTATRAVSGFSAIDQPLGQAQAIRGGAGRQRMKRGRHGRLDHVAGDAEIAFDHRVRDTALVGRQLPHDRGRRDAAFRAP